MAYLKINVVKSVNNYSGGLPILVAEFEVDDVASLPAQNQTTYSIGIGSTAHVIENNSTYKMQSNGTWVLQYANGYYTETQIDDMFANIPNDVFGRASGTDYELDSGDDLNAILLPGNYTAGSTTIAGGVANSPWTATRYKFVNLVITGSASTNIRAVQFIFPNLYTSMANYPGVVFFMRYRHNATFTPWATISGTPVNANLQSLGGEMRSSAPDEEEIIDEER